jgi:imidazolonepropionase-like amidohydrolase
MTEGTPRFSLLSAARLLDGTQRAPLEDAALLLDGERIARLGRRDDVHAPDGTAVQRVDHGDATLLPGLVEAHTHLVAPGDGTLGDDIAKEDDDILLLQAARNARTLLHSGVTTLRENGAKGRVAFSLQEGIRRKLAPGPRMVICGRPIADHRQPHGLLRVGGRRRGRGAGGGCESSSRRVPTTSRSSPLAARRGARIRTARRTPWQSSWR